MKNTMLLVVFLISACANNAPVEDADLVWRGSVADRSDTGAAPDTRIVVAPDGRRIALAAAEGGG